jgi:hypothetical protein
MVFVIELNTSHSSKIGTFFNEVDYYRSDRSVGWLQNSFFLRSNVCLRFKLRSCAIAKYKFG